MSDLRKTLRLLISLATTAASFTAMTADQPASNREMAGLLSRIARQTRDSPNDYSNEEQIERLRSRLKQPLPPHEQLQSRFQLAEELLKARHNDEAVGTFEGFISDLKSQAPEVYAGGEAFFTTRLAIAYLRQAEQDNCIHHHNPESCLFPIRNGGVHSNRKGSTKVRDILAPLLRKNPDYLPARWLYCVAAMTLGEYPHAVPEAWQFPKDAFRSDYDIKRFPEVAAAAGLGVDGLAGGVCMEDFDNDGWLDIAVSSWGVEDQLRVFRNLGNGRFEDRTREAGLAGIVGGLNLVHADYNNDGRIDILVLRGAWLDGVGKHPNSLLRNNGDGSFTDVTRQSGLLSFRPTQTAAWFDYDGDGWLDLYIGNESNGGHAFPCELFRNNGDGSFTEVAAASRVNFSEYIKAVVSGDFNNDGRPDLFLSNTDGPNRLLRNDGPMDPASPDPANWRFTEVGHHAGIQRPIISFPSWFWDFDNDGWEDLLVLDYDGDRLPDLVHNYLGRPMFGEGMKLYRNLGDGTFADVTRRMGLEIAALAMGSNFGDLDNDGWLDFYVGTGIPDLGAIFPNRMFRNANGQRFQDVTTSGGFGHLQKGHGVAFGDLDNDGDQDVYAVMGGAFSGDRFFNAVFANPGHSNNWIKLRLIGTRSNRSAIGARVKLSLHQDGALREIHRSVGSGGSFGANPLLLEIGVGSAESISDLEIRWPGSPRIQRFSKLEVNRLLVITEGAENPVAQKVPAIRMNETDQKSVDAVRP